MSTKYRTMVVDPPWEYPGGFNGFGNRQALPYPSMTLAEIKALPVADLLQREGYVFCWTTNRYLEHAFSVVRAWECTPKQILVWCKEPMGKGLGGMFVTTTEFVIVGQKLREGSNAHGARTNGERVGTSWFQWKRPYSSEGKPMHSAKPDGFLDLVEQVSPAPYAELFARRARFGWDYPIGDQALGGVAA